MKKGYDRIRRLLGNETVDLLVLMVLLALIFSFLSPRFLTSANLASMGYQAPLLGLLTIAMLAPMISGGLNLAIVYTANIAGLTMATVLLAFGGPDAGPSAIVMGSMAAIAVGALAGAMMGLIIAYVGAHPILVSLAMMIFLRGLGEFLTRGGDISGFPTSLATLGHGSVFGLPTPLLLFAVVAMAWQVLLRKSRHGFSVYMVGSNIQAAAYSGLPTRRNVMQYEGV